MKKQIFILVDKNPFVKKIFEKIYKLTLGKYINYKRNKIFKENAKEALITIDNAFQELGVDYWLEFGTLLGAVREKDFIEHDIDIDLGCFENNYNPQKEIVFKKYGLKKIQEILIDNGSYGREETYQYKGINIDIFYFHQRENNIYCHVFTKIKGKTWPTTIKELGGLIVQETTFPFNGFKKIEFLGRKFNIPLNIEEHLSANYGNNYLIKDKNYTNSNSTNVKIIEGKIGVLYEY